MAWSLGIAPAALLVAGLLAITGTMNLNDTVLGTYSGMHVLGLVLAVVGMLALVAALVRSTAKT